jgi:hypothetical protein
MRLGVDAPIGGSRRSKYSSMVALYSVEVQFSKRTQLLTSAADLRAAGCRISAAGLITASKGRRSSPRFPNRRKVSHSWSAAPSFFLQRWRLRAIKPSDERSRPYSKSATKIVVGDLRPASPASDVMDVETLPFGLTRRQASQTGWRNTQRRFAVPEHRQSLFRRLK